MVKSCNYTSSCNDVNVSLFSFPDKYSQEWIKVVGRGDDWLPKKYTKICSTHFGGHMIRNNRLLTGAFTLLSGCETILKTCWSKRIGPPEGNPGQLAYTFLIRILSTSFISVSIFSVCCYSRVSISMAVIFLPERMYMTLDSSACTSYPSLQRHKCLWRFGKATGLHELSSFLLSQ
jgi:hypothetical protein